MSEQISFQLEYTGAQVNEKLGKVEKAVLYTEQALTDEQKAQARVNIGVAAVAGGGVSSWNDLTDKPFYEESGTEVVLEETIYEGFASDSSLDGAYAMGTSAQLILVAGQNYKVIWDESEHTCTAFDFNMNGYDWVGLGNDDLLTGTATSPVEPFVVAYSEEITTLTLVALDGSTDTSHRVGIYHETTTIKTLDSKYLPMDAIDERIEKYIGEALEGEY